MEYDLEMNKEELLELEALEEMEKIQIEMGNMVRSLRFWIETIVEEDDVELLELALDSMTEITGVDVRHFIKNGFGDYKMIQEKCIGLGLV